MLYQSKTLLEFDYNSLFYTHIDNGLWDIATVTMQYWKPESRDKSRYLYTAKNHFLILRKKKLILRELFLK